MEEKSGSTPQLVRGLRDVIAGQSGICLMDEKNGKLYYCGYDVKDLVERATFEDVAYLLIDGELPKEGQFFPSDFYKLSPRTIKAMQAQLKEAHPMGILGVMVETEGNVINCLPSNEDPFLLDRQRSLMLCVKLSLMCAAMGRWYQNQKPILKPGGYQSVAKNFLYQLRGKEPDPLETRALEVASIIYAEHELPASTLVDRIAASTHSDIFSATVAAICALKGPRHGGANEQAMKTMLKIGKPENVRTYCDDFLNIKGARLPGFGHPVYEKLDPRVPILKPWVYKLSQYKKDMRWYEIAIALEEYMAERAAKKGKGIPPNPDLWTAPLYYLLGIPITLFTPLFAAARVSGWGAHYLEVRHILKEPIIRPRLEYIGPVPRPYPTERRA